MCLLSFTVKDVVLDVGEMAGLFLGKHRTRRWHGLPLVVIDSSAVVTKKDQED